MSTGVILIIIVMLAVIYGLVLKLVWSALKADDLSELQAAVISFALISVAILVTYASVYTITQS